eukprot:TRINITY_DN3788_c0_g1_i1.p1 TRINITY_DN3788_c0_g1~~TRINITY_DN3788_c0_g1_i1.p1  ORF type:complete len:279 (+),score=29.46 TRINITY_DN3788_c0_g1_i1:95-838(+)
MPKIIDLRKLVAELGTRMPSLSARAHSRGMFDLMREMETVMGHTVPKEILKKSMHSRLAYMIRSSKGTIHFEGVDEWVHALGNHPVLVECYEETRSIPRDFQRGISDMSSEMYDLHCKSQTVDLSPPLSELPMNKACRLTVPAVTGNPEPRDSGIIIYRSESTVNAFSNRCPHVGIPMDQNGDIWAPEYSVIRCSAHFALFNPESGLCVNGPCTGKYLERVPFTLTGGKIRLKIPTVGNLMASLDRR